MTVDDLIEAARHGDKRMLSDAATAVDENERLRLALDEIGRVALACWMDMQGRLADDEHRRAHNVLGSIIRQANRALGDQD